MKNRIKQNFPFIEENKFLMWMLVVVFLLAVVSYLGAAREANSVRDDEKAFLTDLRQSRRSEADLVASLQAELQALDQREYGIEFLHHLSLAFIISFITILAVEFHTRRQMRRDLDSHIEAAQINVWQALGKRLLGSLIAVELEAIMKEDAAKKDSEYVITFKPPNKGFPDDRLVVQIENSYKLRNLTGVPGRTHRIFSSISNFEKIDSYPRFTSFKINDETQPISEALGPDDSKTLSKVVPLPEDGESSVAVLVGMEIVYKTRDSESFVTAVPVEGLRVTIVNQVPDKVGSVSVDVSSGKAIQMTDTSWVFERAMLPGQGFSLNWREPDSKEGRQTVTQQSTKNSVTI
jgi:hypothetical protein